MDWFLLVITFTLTSFMPGINMLYALNLSLKFGWRKTIFMILGGVFMLGMVSLLVCFGLGLVMLSHKAFYETIKIAGGIYVIYLGLKAYGHSGKISSVQTPSLISSKKLFLQGLFVCALNPKAWLLLGALIPKFLNQKDPFLPQVLTITFVIMIIEFVSFNCYALGGLAFKKLMKKNSFWLGRISAVVMVVVGFYIIFD